MRLRTPRSGLTPIDVLVVLFLAGVLALVLLMAVPRGREQARLMGCQKNLAQIGMALAMYDQMERCLPTIGRPASMEGSGRKASPGPLKILLETLGLSDFGGLTPKAPLPSPAGPVPGEIPVPGFVCSSDGNATAGLFRAPISYRGCTGDGLSGNNGVFAPGRRISLVEVELGDGSSFTAAASERLVGDSRSGFPARWNYATVPVPLPINGFTLTWLEEAGASWHGDAGSSWLAADYRSTLYNHSLVPGAASSCIAADGAAAYMGASSGHVRGVNLLMLDGAVKLVLPTINARVWSEFAAISGGETRASKP